METTTENQVSCKSSNQSLLSDEDLLASLETLEPKRSQVKTTQFAKAYPTILRAIAKNVPQNAILEVLAKGGMKLHPARYRAMLVAEKERRDSRNEHIHCELCHSVLQVTNDSNASRDDDFEAKSTPVAYAISKVLPENEHSQAKGAIA